LCFLLWFKKYFAKLVVGVYSRYIINHDSYNKYAFIYSWKETNAITGMRTLYAYQEVDSDLFAFITTCSLFTITSTHNTRQANDLPVVKRHVIALTEIWNGKSLKRTEWSTIRSKGINIGKKKQNYVKCVEKWSKGTQMG
jgi:hypothetical protein